MKQQLYQIRDNAMKELQNTADLVQLDEIRVKYLGKKGELTSVLKGMGALSSEERPVIGQLANEIRDFIEAKIGQTLEEHKKKDLEKRLQSETLDISLPGKKRGFGHKHPITMVIDEIKDVFLGMGYSIAEGPEIELDFFNFEAMNMPKNHPARDVQDTFYMNDNVVLRTHTSPVQARTMMTLKPPIRVICPGRVYRSDEVDATHSPVFHQVEALVVDKGITMGDLVGTLQHFAKKLFGENTKIRLRPHHFRFTEPSAEVDVSCWGCGGVGCRLCKGEGWVEILGAGMVNPKVLRACGIDPDIYSGFAFGLGVERVAMARFNIDDLRLFFENDVRFLGQF